MAQKKLSQLASASKPAKVEKWADVKVEKQADIPADANGSIQNKFRVYGETAQVLVAVAVALLICMVAIIIGTEVSGHSLFASVTGIIIVLGMFLIPICLVPFAIISYIPIIVVDENGLHRQQQSILWNELKSIRVFWNIGAYSSAPVFYFSKSSLDGLSRTECKHKSIMKSFVATFPKTSDARDFRAAFLHFGKIDILEFLSNPQ